MKKFFRVVTCVLLMAVSFMAIAASIELMIPRNYDKDTESYFVVSGVVGGQITSGSRGHVEGTREPIPFGNYEIYQIVDGERVPTVEMSIEEFIEDLKAS